MYIIEFEINFIENKVLNLNNCVLGLDIKGY